ncbi:MAG: TatD family hydrolase, partial [Minwuiales bacterium]|nr:TatD family hydrolase [Minwuiales bacterium]
LDDVMGRARAAGVGSMVTISTKLTTFPEVLAIAERFEDVHCSVGVHPHEAEPEAGVDRGRLVELAKHPKVVGIGETGLDYFYEHSPREAQRRLFREHIAAARETGLPLIVHTRDADDDTAAILTEEMGQGRFEGLIHCFSTSRELAETSVGLGLYISLSGILTFNKAQDLRDTAAALPMDRLLVETDSPYLAPAPKRGKPNEPAFVVHTAAKLGEIKGLTPDVVAEATTRNFFELFRKVPKAA